MSPELKALLAAEDLDDAGDARKQIKAVSDVDAAAIRSILKRWQDAQAVANLLFHADLIPEDVRLATLFRGLGDQREHYYALAALCGLPRHFPVGQAVLRRPCRAARTSLSCPEAALSFLRSATPLVAARGVSALTLWFPREVGGRRGGPPGDGLSGSDARGYDAGQGGIVMIELTEQQRRELNGPEPIRARDPQTNETYVLLRADVYERLRALSYDDSPWTDEEKDLLAAEAGEMLDQYGKEPCR